MGPSSYFFKSRRWQVLSAFACFLYGIVSILNVHSLNEGLWFWYAHLIAGGHRLYADLHLPLQPLFVLLNVGALKLFGDGWLASKSLAIAQLLAFCVGLVLVADLARWKDGQKAIVIAAVFGMTMGTTFFRFDDFHITSDCLELYAIYILFRIFTELNHRKSFLLTALLGGICGLSLMNRLNDGAALFVGCGFVAFFLISRRRVLGLAIFCSTGLLTVFAVVSLTGDSIHEWVFNSIIGAAAIKGGTGHALYGPFQVSLQVFEVLLSTRHALINLVYDAVLAMVCVLMQRYGRRQDGRLWTGRIAFGVGFILITFPLVYRAALYGGVPQAAIAMLAAIVSWVLAVWVLLRLFLTLVGSEPANRDARELILLLPFLQMMGTAVTSGKSMLWGYSTAATLLILLPICSPFQLRKKWQSTAYVAVAGLITVSALITKSAHPYEWIHYVNQPLFVGRQWYRHPQYGPMYIERDQLRFVRSVCNDISKDGSPNGLLSITYPYANYFCNTPPWHGYVQTWYDTSSKLTIDSIVSDLQTSPPQWILYQREPDTMLLHERMFLDGRPLPHRVLDRLIMERIANGRWAVVRRENLQGCDWILIRTDV